MIDPFRFHLPVANRIYTSEAVCFHHRYLMGSKSDMDQIAALFDAFKKQIRTGYFTLPNALVMTEVK